MSQRKKTIELKRALEAAVTANQESYLSAEEQTFRLKLNEMRAKNVFVFLAVIGASADKKVKKVVIATKRQTKKEQKEIMAETRKELKAMAPLILPPYTVIIPAPGLGKLTPAALCNYCIDKFPRINSVPAFATCLPSVDYCQAIYDELFPLASIGKGIGSDDRLAMNILVKQLRENFGATINSVANLSNGNPKLFSLINVNTKRKSVKNTKRLGAPVVTINTKLGQNTLGVRCKPIRFAKSYTVAIGTGDDLSTYKNFVGTSNQLIDGLTGGDLVNVYMWANTGKQAGYPSIVQSVRVPFS